MLIYFLYIEPTTFIKMIPHNSLKESQFLALVCKYVLHSTPEM